MTRIAPIPPAESDLLCEFCGYTLNGLSEESNCPECGMPIAASLGSKRQPPRWERDNRGNALVAFITETSRIIFHPTTFFRWITARGDMRRAARFGHAHWIMASLLFGVAGSTHAGSFFRVGMGSTTPRIFTGLQGMIILSIVSYFSLWFTTRLAVRLSAWEAAYRGYRLPLPVVMRTMYYHAAHYVPVAWLAVAIVLIHDNLLERHLLDATSFTKYLYVLCGGIVVAAAYLFKTYWIGMRNMMYANR